MPLKQNIIKQLKSFFNSSNYNIKANSALGKWLTAHYQDLASFNSTTNTLHFSVQQKKHFRDEFCRDFNERLLSEPLNNLDRLQVSQLSNNEKLAGQNPNDFYVLIKQLQQPIPCLSGPVTLPAGTSLRVPIKLLNFDEITQIIIVENQIVFDQIEKANLPARLSTCLVIYRGHDALATGCRNLLTALAKHIDVIAFTDYDPKGLEITATLPGVSAHLVPELTAELRAKSYLADFIKQHDSLSYLEKNGSATIQTHRDIIESGKLSIKQEHMLEQATPLICEPIAANT